jgi:hypothetical protein
MHFDEDLYCRFPAQNLVLHGVRMGLYVQQKWYKRSRAAAESVRSVLTSCSFVQGCLEASFAVGNALARIVDTPTPLEVQYHAVATGAGLECMSCFPLAEVEGYSMLDIPMPTTYLQLAVGVWTHSDVHLRDPSGTLARMLASKDILLRLGAQHVYAVPAAVRKARLSFPITESVALGTLTCTWGSSSAVMELNETCSNTAAFFLHTPHASAITDVRIDADGHSLRFGKQDFITTEDGVFFMLAGGGRPAVFANCFLDRRVLPFVRTDAARMVVTFASLRTFVFLPTVRVTALECNIATTCKGVTSVAFRNPNVTRDS